MALNSTNLIIESDMTLNKMLGEINTVEIPIIQRDYDKRKKGTVGWGNKRKGTQASGISCTFGKRALR